jgi:hypothetical protein
LPLLSQILEIIPKFSKTQNWRLFNCGNVQKSKVGVYNKKKLFTQDWLFHSFVDQYLVLRRHPFSKLKHILRQKSIFFIF